MIFILVLSMIIMGMFFLYETATLRLILLKHCERLERRAIAITSSAKSKNERCQELISQMDILKSDLSMEKEFYRLADEHDSLGKEIEKLINKGNHLNKYNHLLLDLMNTWCLPGAHNRIKRLVRRHCFESDYEEVMEEG